ncbi:hypothetical protein OG588_15605 [Streptomyces prunicolor]|uniref:hypothetical protein n=1 Tax=Streptomyces prunicolor TaxID=67348 RepID=UPI003868FE64|nr:hypothetical protein OG588_15605 [Streptomyces prunicolor]
MSEITLVRDGLDAAKEEPSQLSEDLLLEAFSSIGENDIADPVLATPTQVLLPAAESDGLHAVLGGADRAIAWYRARLGSTAYEGWCEKAARTAWGCPVLSTRAEVNRR